MKRKEEGFNTPFERLEKRPAVAAEPAAPMRGRRDAVSVETGRDDDDAFRSAVRGVTPAKGRARVALRPERATKPPVDDDAEVVAALAELVVGSEDFDFSDTSEYVEARAIGLDPRVVIRLRKGEFAIEGTLDLHGFTKEAARRAVMEFIEREQRAGHRCVLIVHGRGLHSRDHVPVLKEELKGWLGRGRMGRAVLAFTSAQPGDGGTGALYVLLRRVRR